MRTQPPSQKVGGAPQFSAHVYCGQTAGWIKMALGMEIDPGPVQSTLCYMGTQLPPQKRGQTGRAPQFLAHLYCGQTLWPNGRIDQDAVWYGGRPRPMRHCSVWTQLPLEKRAHPLHPIFGPCLLWPNGWMDEDAAWYGSRPRPRPHCTRRGRSSRERGTAAPLLWPMSIVATVAHLSYC